MKKLIAVMLILALILTGLAAAFADAGNMTLVAPSGAPALTVNPVGSGLVYAFGAVFGEEAVRAFTRELNLTSPVQGRLTLPEEIELSVRVAEDGTQYIFLLNYDPKPQDIHVNGALQDLLSGEEVCGAYTVPPYGVLVLKA